MKNKWCLLLLTLLLFYCPKAETQNLGDLSIQPDITRHTTGWSEWSLVDSYPGASVSAYIYIEPNWGAQQDTTSKRSDVTVTTSETGVLLKNVSSQNVCVNPLCEEPAYTSCDPPNNPNSVSDGTCCTYPGNWRGVCSNGSNDCNNTWQDCENGGIKCYYFSCNTFNSHSGSTYCCHFVMHYYFVESTGFKDKTVKSNWRNSLTEAGGYALKVKVYSYPQRVYINYDGNEADAICGTGKQAKWTAGSNSLANDNSYASNRSIKYTDGNPTCSQTLTNAGVMTRDSSVYISYFEGETVEGNYNLHENEYYRSGYDFVGWSATRITNTTNPTATFADKERVTVNAQKSGVKSISAEPGETITLYAVWRKHNYKIQFNYLCGAIDSTQATTATDNVSQYPYTYQIGGMVLKDLKVASCSSSSAANNGPTGFLGWYEDIAYTKRLTEIPATYAKDLKLYAKENQKRYYNYKTGKWTYFSG